MPSKDDVTPRGTVKSPEEGGWVWNPEMYKRYTAVGWDIDRDGTVSDWEARLREQMEWRRANQHLSPDEASRVAAQIGLAGGAGAPSVEGKAGVRLLNSGMPGGVHHADELRRRWEDMALAERRANPYDMEAARRTQAAQGALLDQMAARQAGPSAVDLMGRAALGQNAMSALAAAGRGALGARAALGQQGAVGGDLAARVAQARLAEQLGMSQGRFGVASNMRGGALQTAGDQSKFGLGVRELDNRRALAGIQGANALFNANVQAGLNRDRAFNSLTREGDDTTTEMLKTGANFLGPLFGGFL